MLVEPTRCKVLFGLLVLIPTNPEEVVNKVSPETFKLSRAKFLVDNVPTTRVPVMPASPVTFNLEVGPDVPMPTLLPLVNKTLERLTAPMTVNGLPGLEVLIPTKMPEVSF